MAIDPPENIRALKIQRRQLADTIKMNLKRIVALEEERKILGEQVLGWEKEHTRMEKQVSDYRDSLAEALKINKKLKEKEKDNGSKN